MHIKYNTKVSIGRAKKIEQVDKKNLSKVKFETRACKIHVDLVVIFLGVRRGILI